MKLFVTILSLLSIASTAMAASEKYSCLNIDALIKNSSFREVTQLSTAELIKNNLRPNKIFVSKEQKKLYLLQGDILLRSYDVAFGRDPFGHKLVEGDNKTPEGKYLIDFKKKESEYYRALHISYPNKLDVERTRKLSESKGVEMNPGGDIMIHGLPNDETLRSLVDIGHPLINWTRGCIAVTNSEIEEIYQLVPIKTEIEICPAQSRGEKLTPLKISNKLSSDFFEQNLPNK